MSKSGTRAHQSEQNAAQPEGAAAQGERRGRHLSWCWRRVSRWHWGDRRCRVKWGEDTDAGMAGAQLGMMREGRLRNWPDLLLGNAG